LNNTIYNFEWFYNGNLIPLQTQSSVTVNQLGTYSVIATNTVTGCFSDTITANLVGSTPGKSLLINHSSAFSDNPFVEINVIGGDGNYQYQLDNGFFQTSPLFYGIIPGEHEVRVIDSLRCTNLTGTFTTIGFIPFFTPNGDGYNDTWNINGLENNPKSNINIFDRYGKLIKNIKPNSTGWDGTFNGQQLLSTDYWFTIDYVENGESKVFKSHFSLKR
jgi:gliding motility-associated-like protein